MFPNFQVLDMIIYSLKFYQNKFINILSLWNLYNDIALNPESLESNFNMEKNKVDFLKYVKKTIPLQSTFYNDIYFFSCENLFDQKERVNCIDLLWCRKLVLVGT